MKDSDKNRDPEKAIKRARGDARCALKKLNMLAHLEIVARDMANDEEDSDVDAWQFVEKLALALGIETDVCPECKKPAHATETDDAGFHKACRMIEDARAERRSEKKSGRAAAWLVDSISGMGLILGIWGIARILGAV